MLKLTLFGAPQVALHQQNLTNTLAGRPLALLAYLAVTGQAHDRNLLADLLWAEVAEAEARRNLRNTLYLLRQAVGDYLRTDRQRVALDTTRPQWVDVTVFAEQFANGYQQHHPTGLVQEAFDLYQGDFLAGLHINEAPAFESWVAARRHQLQEQAFHGWHWLANHYLTTHDYSAGLAVTQRMLLLQPWREEAHCQQMLLLAANGQRSAALAQYEQCRHLLAAELAVEPMPATVALYEQLKRGESLALLMPMAPPRTQRNGHSPASLIVQPVLETLPRLVDVGAMPITPYFLGRQAELTLLHQWLVLEKRRCVTIIGMGGQGKSTLAAHLVTTLQEEAASSSFACIIWRSLLNAPPIGELLQDWLHTLSNAPAAHAPATRDQQLAHLLQQLRWRRCLLILDNWESILPVADAPAPLSAEQQGYGQLLRTLLQTEHQSSLLLTSREQPRALTSGDETTGVLRTLALTGLDQATGVKLLERYGLPADLPTLAPLVEHFSGNPLALHLVIDTIDHLFAGNVAAFLAQESHFFGDIGALLDQQFTQLTPMQRTLLHWLALAREPLDGPTLWADLVQPSNQRAFWEALRTLQRRALVETHNGRFGLQNVILEYTTERLLEALVQGVVELAVPGGQLLRRDPADLQSLIDESPLNQYALLKAQTKEYIRQTQRRLLLTPLVQRLTTRWGVPGLAARMQALLTVLRTLGQRAQADGYGEADGYLAANLLTLLLHGRVDLRGYDFSYLTLRQPYLCDVALPAVNFAHSHFRDARFTDPFDVVGALAFSPDGQWLITGSFDGLIRLWRTDNGQLHQLLDGDQREIGTLAVAPNGEWLASACGNSQVRLWHLPSLTRHLDLTVAFNFPQPLAFSPDSQWLALTGEHGVVQVLTVATGATIWQSSGLSSLPQTLAFSPTGDWLAAGCQDGVIAVWHLTDSWRTTPTAPIACWQGHQNRLLALLWTPDGQHLITGGADHALRCWAVAQLALMQGTPQPHWQARAHQDAVTALALVAAGRLFASSSPDGTIRLWDSATGAPLAAVEAAEQRVRALAGSADGHTLASSGSSQRIYLWSVEGAEPTHPRQKTTSPLELAAAPVPTTVHLSLRQTIHGYANQLRAIAFLPHTSLLVGGGTDKMVHLWDTTTGQVQQSWRGHSGWVQAIAASPDGVWVASADQTRQILLWNSRTPTATYQTLQRDTESSHLLLDLSFSPAGQWLAAAGGNTLTLWRMSDRPAHTAGRSTPPFADQQTLLVARGNLATIAFHPTGDLIAAATSTGDLYFWQTDSGRLLQTIPQAAPSYLTIAFSADGQRLISATMTGVISAWDLRFVEGTPVGCHRQHTLCHQSGAVVTLAVSGAGDTLATGAYDGVVCLWESASGALRHRLTGHEGWITRVSYSPDGQLLASAATDGLIKLWRVSDGLCVQTLTVAGPYAAMNITNSRGLTAAQRRALLTLGAVDAGTVAYTLGQHDSG